MLLLVAVIVLVAWWAHVTSETTGGTESQGSRQQQKGVPASVLQTLVRNAARWATAAAQDTSPLIAVLHANYGAAYVWALQDVATPEVIEAATGVDFVRLRTEVVNVQQQATQQMVDKCPSYVPNRGDWLAAVAGEG